MSVIDNIIKEHFIFEDEDHYDFIRKRYPEYAVEWIEELKFKKRIAADVIRLKESGMSGKKIAEKLNAPYKMVLKLIGELHGQYARIVVGNRSKLLEAAGDTRDPKVVEDYKYINDPRTITTEMNVLLPRIDEIRSLINE